MSMTATVRLAIAASVVALTAAAPVAFAQNASDSTYRPEGAATDTTAEPQTAPGKKVRTAKHMKHKKHKKMMRHHRATSPGTETPGAAPKY